MKMRCTAQVRNGRCQRWAKDNDRCWQHTEVPMVSITMTVKEWRTVLRVLNGPSSSDGKVADTYCKIEDALHTAIKYNRR